MPAAAAKAAAKAATKAATKAPTKAAAKATSKAATRTSALTSSCISLQLRSEQLKRLSFLCGLPVSGRKDELVARLALASGASSRSGSKSKSKSKPLVPAAKSESLQQQQQQQPVVLSIDLGIKNLAFSLLTPVPVASATATTKKLKKASGGGGGGGGNTNPTDPPAIELYTWKRLSFLDPRPIPTSTATTGASEQQQQNEDTITIDTEEEGEGGVILPDTSESLFSPESLAKTANSFLQETVLRMNPLPTHILIERQRWRSGGAAAIQEWTVRVNTLEAMLHASLRTLQDLGAWKGEVVCVKPERVGQFFLPDSGSSATPVSKPKTRGKKAKKIVLDDDEMDDVDNEEDISAEETTGKELKKNKRGGRKTSAETKRAKIALLSHWLEEKDRVVRPANSAAQNMLDAYRTAVNRHIFRSTASNAKATSKTKAKTKAKRAKEGEVRLLTELENEEKEGNPVILDKKLDDLTDSLMQGMVWLRWQENMALLRSEGGVEKLLQGP